MPANVSSMLSWLSCQWIKVGTDTYTAAGNFDFSPPLSKAFLANGNLMIPNLKINRGRCVSHETSVNLDIRSGLTGDDVEARFFAGIDRRGRDWSRYGFR